MATVHFASAPREWYRTVIVEEEEVWCTIPSSISYLSNHLRMRSPGCFYVPKALEPFKGTRFGSPDLIICYADPDNPPCDIARAPGKKVLMIGDTHHGMRALEKNIRLALAEPWDLVVVQFTPNHLAWFLEAGVRNVAYIPCFMVNPIRLEPKRERRRGIVFVGQTDPTLFPRRAYVLEQLRKRGYPVEVLCTGMDQKAAAEIYNDAAVSLNIALNMDVNLRNFEILAAGGTLLSDGNVGPSGIRISPWSDLDNLCDLIDIARHDSLREAQLKEDREGFQWFWRTFHPSLLIKRIFDGLAHSEYAKSYPRPDESFWLRLAAYEAWQEEMRVTVEDDARASLLAKRPR